MNESVRQRPTYIIITQIETASQRTYTLSTGMVGADADATRVRWLDALESPNCVALFDKAAAAGPGAMRMMRNPSSQTLRSDASFMLARSAANTASVSVTPPAPPAAGGSGKPSTATAAAAPAPAPIPLPTTASSAVTAVASPGVSESPQVTTQLDA